jgi:hypothetical protein
MIRTMTHTFRLLALFILLVPTTRSTLAQSLSLGFEQPHWLIIRNEQIPGKAIRVNYMEAYCRAGSTDADWVAHTVIKHSPQLISLSPDQRLLKLRDTAADGVVIDHEITARTDEVVFQISAHNPTQVASEIHWAQPCIRLGDFTGYDNQGKDLDDYLPKCFIFLDGKLTRMDRITPWNKQARYVPGQVWCPKHVPRTDVNPRPLSVLVPSNGLIGCFSSDDQWIFAVAFEPYQELFQGVARCVHADVRIGGLDPGQSKSIRGKMYLMRNDAAELLSRYEKDFPEQTEKD